MEDVRVDTVHVQMRDGIELVGDLYRPGGADASLPTLVRKTPYDHARNAPDDRFYAAHGYAVLVVSFRGRFGSGGTFHQARNEGWHEHPDGYDTIEWAAAQPWSTGAIGTYGISSDAQWQLTSAATRPPHLKAMFVSYPAFNYHGHVERGSFTNTGPGWYSLTGAFARPLRDREDWHAWLADWRADGLPLLASFAHPDLVESFMHPIYDDYWRELDPATRYADVDVPIYHECGWYDRYIRATFQHFTGIRAQARSARARSGQKLIMGPWVHGGRVAPETEAVHFGSEAAVDRRALHLRWFDYWLKGEETGVMDEPPVRLYVMGAERWLVGDGWPLPSTREDVYYLHGGSESPHDSLNDGALSAELSRAEPPDTYTHDPYDPVPTIGGHGGTGWIWPAGPLDQRSAEARSLTFTTPPLREDLTVIGEPEVRFFASSSAVDTDFVLTLTDVYPDGYSAVIRQSVVRARYRNGEEAGEELLTPGAVEEYRVRLTGIANQFRAGHRVRLGIASSSFPAFLPNPGTAEPLHLATRGVVAENAVYHDACYPSHLSLPVYEA